MGCIILGAIKFYMLAEGESYPDPYGDGNYCGAYVVFPYQGKWIAQKCVSKGKWKDITDQRFETENLAFNYAYEFDHGNKRRYMK